MALASPDELDDLAEMGWGEDEDEHENQHTFKSLLSPEEADILDLQRKLRAEVESGYGEVCSAVLGRCVSRDSICTF